MHTTAPNITLADQLADKPNRGQPIRGLVNSRTHAYSVGVHELTSKQYTSAWTLVVFATVASSYLTQILRWRNMLTASYVAVSTSFDNYRSNGPSADQLRSMLRTLSFTAELVAATPSLLESAMESSESCKQYCTLLLVW